MSAAKLTAGWRSATWRYPIDPECADVRGLLRGLSAEQVILASEGSTAEWHRARCKRCYGYGHRHARMTTDADRERHAQEQAKRDRLTAIRAVAGEVSGGR